MHTLFYLTDQFNEKTAVYPCWLHDYNYTRNRDLKILSTEIIGMGKKMTQQFSSNTLYSFLDRLQL